MDDRRAHARLLLCLAGSLGLHASLTGFTVLITMSGAGAPQPRAPAPDAQRQPLEPPLPEPVEMTLGLDAPNPPSRTWVGYEEYQKHAAARAEVEQAAFTDDPVAAALAAADMRDITPRFDSAQAAAARQQLARQSQSATPPPETVTTPPASSPPPVRNSPEAEPSAAPDLERLFALNDLLAPMFAPAHAPQQVPETRQRPTTQPTPPPTTVPARESRDAPSLTQPAPRPAETQPADSPRPVARSARGAPNTGAQSDRESDPSSIIDVPREHWQLGKPLAAQGLELKPRRPDVTILTQLTAWPRNPTAQITFDRTGVPTLAVLLIDTGDSRVDAAIIAALYRWRAAGKPLEQMKDGDTIDITIRLLINPERKRIDGE
jgi:hypothetical protein